MAESNETRQYSLFDETEWQKQELYIDLSDGVDLQKLDLGDLFNFLNGKGMYVPIPAPELWERGRTYYKQHIGQISDYLNASGLTQEQITCITKDYGNALLGNFNFAASINTMIHTLNKVKPYDAFVIDKYGFYRLLLLQYYNYGRITAKYLSEIKTASPKTQYNYIATFPTMEHRAAAWALRAGYMRLSDFAGVPKQKIAEFAENAYRFASLFDYGQYYHLCKMVFLATPEQLKTIRTPQALADIEAQGIKNFAEDFCTDIENGLSNAARQYVAPSAMGKTPQETEQAQEQAQEWNIKPISLSLNNTFLNIQTRGVYGVPNGEIKGGILPIKTYIEKFLTDNQIKFNVTPYQIEQAIDGVNIMALDKQGVKPVNGYYTYHTNLSEFSRYCGLIDANQTTNKELLNALRVIDFAAWLVVWRPKGPAAVRVLTITEISENGDFTVNVTTEAMKGKPNLVTQQGYEKLRAETKGQPKAHFRNQILSKAHKLEEELINECWDYQTRYDLAKERGEQELKDFLNVWRKKKSQYRKQLRGWFDEYAANGAIVYTYTETKDGKRVYKWTKGKLLKPEDVGTTTHANRKAKGTDEPITDAEIIAVEQSETTQND